MGYRGEVEFRYKLVANGRPLSENGSFNIYNVGERVGQIIILPYPQIEFEEVDKLTDTERGEGGFGHTGK